ncbi:MAG: hypothetical protein AAF648_01640 [Pseudomonadota bacterium]
MLYDVSLPPVDGAPGVCQPRLLVEPGLGEAALVDPPAHLEASWLASLDQLLAAHTARLCWVLLTECPSDPRTLATLLDRHITARLGVGRLTMRTHHKQLPNAGCYSNRLRLFDEHERVQLGTAFGRVRHLSDGVAIRTAFLFDRMAVCTTGGTPVLTPVVDDPLEPLLLAVTEPGVTELGMTGRARPRVGSVVAEQIA